MTERAATHCYALGTAPIGNLFAAVSDDDADAALIRALQRGIVHFDTAPLYGHGLSEVRLGNFLRVDPGLEARVTTKVGRMLIPGAAVQSDFASPMPFTPQFDYSRDGILRSFDDSLTRLGVERVHALLLHDLGARTHGDKHPRLFDLAVREALPAMQQLKAEGVIDAVGLGVNEWEIGRALLDRVALDQLLLAGRYTLLEQGALVFLNDCAARGVGVVIGGVYNSGLLTGSNMYDYAAAPVDVIDRRDRLAQVCRDFTIPLPAAALQFVAAHPAVIRTVVGLRSAAEVDALFAFAQQPIAPEFWTELKRQGLIDEAAPTPC